jgi:protein-arginine kinase activator protein McsA
MYDRPNHPFSTSVKNCALSRADSAITEARSALLEACDYSNFEQAEIIQDIIRSLEIETTTVKALVN